MARKRTKRQKLRGKGRAAAGAETCVFMPVVACQDGRGPKGDPKDYVSRIVQDNADDRDSEKVLRENFPLLDQHRMISVSELDCTPKYKKGVDNVPVLRQRRKNGPLEGIDDASKRGCINQGIDAYGNLGDPNLQSNLVTPKFAELKLPGTRQGNLLKLKSALFASVCLVPDNGPWVVHLDLHEGNYLETFAPHPEPLTVDFGIANYTFFKDTTYAAIADWGRVLVITNPTDIGGSIAALKKKRAVYTGWAREGYGQHPLEPMVLLDRAITSAKDVANPVLSRTGMMGIRGLTPYVILSQVLRGQYGNFAGGMTKILQTENQAQLLTAVARVYNAIMTGTGDTFPLPKGGAVPLPGEEPAAAAPGAVPPPAAAAPGAVPRRAPFAPQQPRAAANVGPAGPQPPPAQQAAPPPPPPPQQAAPPPPPPPPPPQAQAGDFSPPMPGAQVRGMRAAQAPGAPQQAAPQQAAPPPGAADAFGMDEGSVGGIPGQPNAFPSAPADAAAAAQGAFPPDFFGPQVDEVDPQAYAERLRQAGVEARGAEANRGYVGVAGPRVGGPPLVRPFQNVYGRPAAAQAARWRAANPAAAAPAARAAAPAAPAAYVPFAGLGGPVAGVPVFGPGAGVPYNMGRRAFGGKKQKRRRTRRKKVSKRKKTSRA